MPKYNQLEIDYLFDEIFDLYPSNEKPSAAKKAFTVAIRKEIDYEDIKTAVQIYALESAGDEYHYHFSNFLNEDHYRDYLDAHRDPATYLKRLEQHKREAMDLIETWNETCRHHWCRCMHPESRFKMVQNALRDEFFHEHWREGLQIASRIFARQLPPSNILSNVNLTLRWFCQIGEKHTVMRLVEGEYGKSKPYEPAKPKKRERPRTEEETQEVKQIADEILGDTMKWLKGEAPKPEDDDEFELE